MVHMEPVVAPFMSNIRLGLCNLIGVMREDVVHTATVNIHILAEMLHTDAGALDVPSRVSNAPWAIPLQRLILKL